MVLVREPEEPDDATAIADILLADVDSLQEVRPLQQDTARIFQMLGRDPECDSLYAGISTALYMLQQR